MEILLYLIGVNRLSEHLRSNVNEGKFCQKEIHLELTSKKAEFRLIGVMLR